MNKEIAQSLKAEAERIAILYSDPERENNHIADTFTVEKVQPLSDHVAVVSYQKSSGKYAICLFFYIPSGAARGRWLNLFPTDSHLLGLQELPRMKLAIEQANFYQNFEVVNDGNANVSSGVFQD